MNQLVGYATLNGGTTGGTGGTTTTISASSSTALAALRAAVTGTSKKIVYINGIVTGDGDTVDVGNFTTVLGVGTNSGLTGSGFRVKKSANIIFRNLKLYKSPAPTDLIEVQYGNNVWIDHNEFYSDLDHDKDFYDGQTDITHGSDFITVSWNIYHDHYKCSLVGHSDNNAAEDVGHLRVTYHHNYFYNINSRTPSLRFGTGHSYNNYFYNLMDSGIDVRLGAQYLAEDNVWENSVDPIETVLNDGYVVQRNNEFINSTLGTQQAGTLTSVPYSYTLDAVASVESIVKANAGLGKVSS